MGLAPYDALDRVTSKSYSDGTASVQYGYDSAQIGCLDSVTSGSYTTTFTGYNPGCQVNASQQKVGTQPYTFQYQYNLAGGLTQEMYPSGRVNTTYDGANRPNGVTGSTPNSSTVYAGGPLANCPGVPTGICYWPHGAMKILPLNNGLIPETTAFSNRLQMTGLTAINAASQQQLLGLTFSYPPASSTDANGLPTGGNNGNLASQTIHNDAVGSEPAFTVTQSYTPYDGVKRLTGFSENGHSQSYGYDAFGNRWVSLSDAVYPANPLTPTQPSAYNAANNRFNVTTNCAERVGDLRV